jgi:hypothetical protein
MVHLVWEMQGELGASHAYEFGGDFPLPHYSQGVLGEGCGMAPAATIRISSKATRGTRNRVGSHGRRCAQRHLLAVNGQRLEPNLISATVGQPGWARGIADIGATPCRLRMDRRATSVDNSAEVIMAQQ